MFKIKAVDKKDLAPYTKLGLAFAGTFVFQTSVIVVCTLDEMQEVWNIVPWEIPFAAQCGVSILIFRAVLTPLTARLPWYILGLPLSQTLALAAAFGVKMYFNPPKIPLSDAEQAHVEGACTSLRLRGIGTEMPLPTAIQAWAQVFLIFADESGVITADSFRKADANSQILEAAELSRLVVFLQTFEPTLLGAMHVVAADSKVSVKKSAATLRREDEWGYVAAPSFEGAKPGMVFKKGEKGTGYYRDHTPGPSGGAEMDITLESSEQEGEEAVTFKSFVLLMLALQAAVEGNRNIQHQLMFRLMDCNGTGLVDKKQFEWWIGALRRSGAFETDSIVDVKGFFGKVVPKSLDIPQLANHFLAKHDKDGDGALSEAEFAAWYDDANAAFAFVSLLKSLVADVTNPVPANLAGITLQHLLLNHTAEVDTSHLKK